jgi:hypothetical protein
MLSFYVSSSQLAAWHPTGLLSSWSHMESWFETKNEVQSILWYNMRVMWSDGLKFDPSQVKNAFILAFYRACIPRSQGPESGRGFPLVKLREQRVGL